jgi:hypothetical protein
MPKVWNMRDKNVPKDAVYVGRPGKWGNPFRIGRDGNRSEVLEKYKEYVRNLLHTSDRFVHDLEQLRGKDLVCWCAPAPCHADILILVANDKAIP